MMNLGWKLMMRSQRRQEGPGQTRSDNKLSFHQIMLYKTKRDPIERHLSLGTMTIVVYNNLIGLFVC